MTDITPENVARMLEGMTLPDWKYDEDWGRITYPRGQICEVFTTDADARFIAWAREAVPALAARLAEVEAERDDYSAQIANLLPAVNREAVQQRTRAEAAEAKLADARDQALEDAAIEVVKPSCMAPSEAHAAAEFIRAMKGAKP